MLGRGRRTITKDEVLECISEAEILHNYLSITKVPCRINSPLRRDRKPSVGIFSPDGVSIRYVDFATGDRGNIFQLLSKMWNLSYQDTLNKILENSFEASNSIKITRSNICSITASSHSKVSIGIVKRGWQKHDLDYWQSYGVSKKWLDYAQIKRYTQYAKNMTLMTYLKLLTNSKMENHISDVLLMLKIMLKNTD